MKTINVGVLSRAIESIESLGQKRMDSADIRFQNVHLRRINELANRVLFAKNDLYVDASGLWDLMQSDKDEKGVRHHHHGLSSSSIARALSCLHDPELVAFDARSFRYLVVTLSDKGKALLAIIETNAPLRGNRNARINKLVTIYEKDEYPSYATRLENRSEIRIYYKKIENRTGL